MDQQIEKSICFFCVNKKRTIQIFSIRDKNFIFFIFRLDIFFVYAKYIIYIIKNNLKKLKKNAFIKRTIFQKKIFYSMK